MMVTVAESLRAIDIAQAAQREKREQTNNAAPAADVRKKFYSSAAWSRARYFYLKGQSRPLRCMCCGATADDGAKIVVDHVISLATPEGWRRRTDQTNLQTLCNGCNFFGKGASADDFRRPA